MLDQRVEVDGQEQFVMNAIKIYTKSVLDAINDGDSSGIKFYSMSYGDLLRRKYGRISIYENDSFL